MQELGIASLASRRFGHLSTGEQRRFLLGRALVHDPPVLVLDEPTSGLDLKACFQYLDLLRMQLTKGKTVLLVTHHLHEIPPEIDRVIFLKEGKVLADGSPTNRSAGSSTVRSPWFRPTAGIKPCQGKIESISSLFL
jgi:iron complex transport system ATP-binding protein